MSCVVLPETSEEAARLSSSTRVRHVNTIEAQLPSYTCSSIPLTGCAETCAVAGQCAFTCCCGWMTVVWNNGVVISNSAAALLWKPPHCPSCFRPSRSMHTSVYTHAWHDPMLQPCQAQCTCITRCSQQAAMRQVHMLSAPLNTVLKNSAARLPHTACQEAPTVSAREPDSHPAQSSAHTAVAASQNRRFNAYAWGVKWHQGNETMRNRVAVDCISMQPHMAGTQPFNHPTSFQRNPVATATNGNDRHRPIHSSCSYKQTQGGQSGSLHAARSFHKVFTADLSLDLYTYGSVAPGSLVGP